jgi:DNA-binding transcriptional ArsR family regulator
MKSTWTAEAVARTAQALAHPVRLQILELLRDEGAYVMHLTRALNRRQAYLSQHLAVLREAGLVVGERRGMTVVYRVSDPRLFSLLDAVREMTPTLGEGTGESTRFWAGVSPLRTVRGCRCPRCCGRE